jgi:hypothetical protein
VAQGTACIPPPTPGSCNSYQLGWWWWWWRTGGRGEGVETACPGYVPCTHLPGTTGARGGAIRSELDAADDRARVRALQGHTYNNAVKPPGQSLSINPLLLLLRPLPRAGCTASGATGANSPLACRVSGDRLMTEPQKGLLLGADTVVLYRLRSRKERGVGRVAHRVYTQGQ